MARVNIEECWWIDPRRSALIRLTGSEETADGAAIKAWRLAQEFWKANQGLVPTYLFDLLGFANELLKVNLAEVRAEGVYIRGSSAYLDWVYEEREARRLGGQKSAQRPRDEKGRLLPKDAPQDKEEPPAETQLVSSSSPTESSSIQVSVSASASVSGSKNKNKESIGTTAIVPASTGLQEVNKKAQVKELTRLKAKEFIQAYVKAYQTKFPGRPEDLNDGKVQGQILNWVKDYPIDRARDLIQVYFQMDTKWFGQKGYDFGTFRNNLNKIGQALDTGKDPDGNSIDWSQVFG
jgi:hypothetical protein